MIANKYSDATNSLLLKRKNGLATQMIVDLQDWQCCSGKIKDIKCDDAGENKALREKWIAAGLEITFKYTVRDTSQLNGKV